jgi:hypothetical protein
MGTDEPLPQRIVMLGNRPLVSGGFVGKLDLGNSTLETSSGLDGDYDAFVVELSAAGDVLHGKSFGGPDLGMPSGDESGIAAADGAGGFVLATNNCGACIDFGNGPLAGPGGTPCMARFDANLNSTWSARLETKLAFFDAAGSPTRVAVAGRLTELYDFGLGLIGPGSFAVAYPISK